MRPTGDASAAVHLVMLLESSQPQRYLAEAEAIFFATSTVTAFANTEARRAFQERWFGRYVTHFPGDVWFAIDTDGHVAGYLTGCPVDTAPLPLFADIGVYRAFRSPCAAYPAHLHVNVAAERRGSQIGSALVSVFVASLAARGVAAVHVVTAAGARNIGFYERNGFNLVESAVVGGKAVVLLGRQC
jgi:ribosomal protein S18 acetylase RimI-like enzyme